ncbi:MAG: M15 family metallopeptidase [Candidatus Pelagadaptatus aseana]|uniref:M15 family metallopeptidase n=1 Tax=Candidatus Pelagadaptatus aseana TaxID=3120508 RepID=UPI0039B35112
MKNASSVRYDFLTGRDESPLCPCWSGHLVHRDVVAPLQRMREAAAEAGFELAVASGYRSYQRQLVIWQDKLAGRRPLLDADEQPLDINHLSETEALWALLRWSAIPGASRHHWGTDLDVFAADALRKQGLALQLTAAECVAGGPLAEFHCWLGEYLKGEGGEDFCRPYALDRGGVAPEPWHISYYPLADSLQQAYDFELFQRLLSENNLPLNHLLDNHAREIFERYISLC